MIQNIKQDICSSFFLAAVLLTAGICLLSPGIGILNMYDIGRPMLIEELFYHGRKEFEGYAEIYNYYTIFEAGTGGYLFAVLPLLSMASVNRYCEEVMSGFAVQKIFRKGRKRALAGNILAGIIVSCLAVLTGLMLFMLIVILRLPVQRLELSGQALHIFFIVLMTGLGSLFGIIITLLTKNKFYAFVIPVLLFYAENEFLMGVYGGMFSNFSIQRLMNPTDRLNGLCFIMIVSAACIMTAGKIDCAKAHRGE